MKSSAKFTRLGVAAFALAALVSSTAPAYEVGDTVPYVIVEGIDAQGALTAEPIVSTSKPTQSFTLVEFFSVADPVSRANLATITAESQDLINDVTTKVIAVDADLERVKMYREDFKEDFLFTLGLDPSQSAMRAFQVKNIPTLFLINDDYKIIFKAEGALTASVVNQMRKTINYDTHSTNIKVGDVAPEVVVPELTTNMATVNRDIRSRQTAQQQFTIVAVSSIYSADAAKNLVPYRDLAARYGARATMRYVSVDADSEAVKRYVQQYPTFFKYPVALDTQKLSAQRFGTESVPTTYVLDVNAKVVFKKSGLLAPTDVSAIQALIQ